MFSVPRVGADLIASITVSVGLIEKMGFRNTTQALRYPLAWRWPLILACHS